MPDLDNMCEANILGNHSLSLVLMNTALFWPLWETVHGYFNPPTIAALQVEIAVEVKISQLPVLTVDPNVHTGAFLTAFYCHFDHPEQDNAFTSQKRSTHFDL